MPTNRESFFRDMELKSDGIIHAGVGIANAVWKVYGDRLDWMESFSPHVSVGIGRTPGAEPYHQWTDPWGCRWIYPLQSLDGQCIGHPVASWSALKDYRAPDPDAFTDWVKTEHEFKRAKEKGEVARGHTDHGFIYLRYTYLRGFENAMADIAEAPPELERLLTIIEDYWLEIVRRWVEVGADMVGFGDDLGLQDRLPISPTAWRKYLKPSFTRIFSYCRSHGLHVSLHTDGYIVDIIPDLIECGVSALNPQELVNGLDTLRELAWGKVFIDMDVDRQNITVFGTPDEVRAHILNCVRTLGSPNGGLSFVWGVYPPTPYENIEAAVRAMDEYATYWCAGES